VGSGQEGAHRSQTLGRHIQACSRAIPAKSKPPSRFCIVELPLMLWFSRADVWLHCLTGWLIGGKVIRTERTEYADFCLGFSNRRCVTHMLNFVVQWFCFVKSLVQKMLPWDFSFLSKCLWRAGLVQWEGSSLLDGRCFLVYILSFESLHHSKWKEGEKLEPRRSSRMVGKTDYECRGHDPSRWMQPTCTKVAIACCKYLCRKWCLARVQYSSVFMRLAYMR
jgi:hypothetical protein